MKRNAYMTVLAALLAMSVSCSRESVREEEFQPEVRICTGVTKADVQDLYQGDDLGLFIDYGSAAPAGYTVSNVRWERNGSDWTPEDQVLWKDASTDAGLYAYSPYVDGQNNHDAIVFTVPGDQTGGTEEADLVSWVRTGFKPNSSDRDYVDGKVQIGFSHSLVKLAVDLHVGTDIPDGVSIRDVTLMGTSQKVTLSLDTQTVTDTQGSLDISMHRTGELRYEAVFWPGSGQEAGSRMFCVTMSNGAAYYFTVPAAGLLAEGFKGGKAYGMNLQVGKEKIILPDSGNIKFLPWFTTGTIPEGELKPAGFAGGMGTEGDPFLISSEAELRHFAELVGKGISFYGKHLRLTRDISVNGDFAPVGTADGVFEGHFDGAGNSIDMSNANLTVAGHACSFFYSIWGRDSQHMASVENLRIHDVNINATEEDELVSASLLCTGANYALIRRCEVSGGISYTADGKYRDLGGMVVDMHNSTIEDCKTNVVFSHTGGDGTASIGGICQYVSSSTIRNCETTSDAGQEREMGGIADLVKSNVTVEGCTVDGHFVKMSKRLGGMFGCMLGGTYSIKDCTVNARLANDGNNNIINCGGFAGEISSGGTGKFENCGFNGSYDYYDDDNYMAFGSDDSDIEFIDCWYSRIASENTAGVGRRTNFTKKCDIQLRY